MRKIPFSFFFCSLPSKVHFWQRDFWKFIGEGAIRWNISPLGALPYWNRKLKLFQYLLIWIFHNFHIWYFLEFCPETWKKGVIGWSLPSGKKGGNRWKSPHWLPGQNNKAKSLKFLERVEHIKWIFENFHKRPEMGNLCLNSLDI